MTDGTHFEKKIYLSYRGADHYGVSEFESDYKNIQYVYYNPKEINYIDYNPD